jgi:RNA polymerase sigma-B factor
MTGPGTRQARGAAARALTQTLFEELAGLTPGTAEHARVRGALIEANLPLVRYVANRFRSRNEPMEDVIQVGTIGLIHAIDRFDLSRQVQFPTFAMPTIIGEIRRYFRDNVRTVHVPRRLHELWVQVHSATEELTVTLGRTPATREIAERLQIPEEEVLASMEAGRSYRVASLEAAQDREDGAPGIGERLGYEDPELAGVEHRALVRHLLIQLPPLVRERFRLSFRVDLGDSAARQVLLLMAPRAIGLGANQITFMINTVLATGVGVGAVTAYNVAFTILQIPLGVIGFPLGVVLLPSMSRAIAAGSVREFGQLVVRSLRLLLYVMLFISAVGIVLRRQVVTLLFEYGFDQRAIDLTANTLLFMLAGLAAHSMVVVLARAFYSGQDTRTPVIVALLAVAVNVAISITTVGTLGLTGLALGIAVGAWFEAILLGVILWQRTPGAGLENITRPLLTFGGGALLAGATALVVVRLTEMAVGLDPGTVVLFGQLLMATAAAGLVYALYSRLLSVPELPQSISLLRSSLRRSRRETDGPADE